MRDDADSPRPDTASASGAGEPARQLPFEGTVRRAVIEHVVPQIDGGRFPVKRAIGEWLTVSCEAFTDGPDVVAGVVRYRHVAAADPSAWLEVPLEPRGNDVWSASFMVSALGTYEYTVQAWIDRFASWLAALSRKADARQDVRSELLEGAALVEAAAIPASGAEGLWLLEIADALRSDDAQGARVAVAKTAELGRLMAARADRSGATTAPSLFVVVDRERARYGAWYEMFPRSATTDPARSGTLREAADQLPRIADMGFDVVYLPPVHPIGRTHRKGRNNAPAAGPDDPGSPWAIGSEAGGHLAVEPELGTLEDFDRFVRMARRLGLEVAIDIAFQASPDHPWTKEHPEWFRHRPDGSIKHAENPPKQYQDIYPFDFESADWQALWTALRDVFLFWVARGVSIFRVDNPHTKPFGFWEWVIADVRSMHPDVVFLAEAFTRPNVMRYLAKAGFNQSYTYFTWRNSAHELREYATELTQSEVREYMRPNFFANTPDILHEYLQTGGRPAFEARLVLAATLSASYGIYSGFELCEREPVRPGSEEYLDSEKYQLRPRDWNQPGNLNELITRVNEIRRRHRALQFNDTLAFHQTANPAFLWFSKSIPDATPSTALAESRVFVVVNTDPHWTQDGHVQMPLWELGIAGHARYVVEDLLDGSRYDWRGEWNYVKLDPSERVAHIFLVHRP
jgi:starch synthase (maltosyl-transferring)